MDHALDRRDTSSVDQLIAHVLRRAHDTAETLNSPDEARALNLFSPAGFEGYFREMGEPAQALTLPPPPSGPPDAAKMSAIGAKYGGKVVGPPPTTGAAHGA